MTTTNTKLTPAQTALLATLRDGRTYLADAPNVDGCACSRWWRVCDALVRKGVLVKVSGESAYELVK